MNEKEEKTSEKYRKVQGGRERVLVFSLEKLKKAK